MNDIDLNYYLPSSVDFKSVLSELELIEPELWFRNCKKSVEKLSTYIRKKLIF